MSTELRHRRVVTGNNNTSSQLLLPPPPSPQEAVSIDPGSCCSGGNDNDNDDNDQQQQPPTNHNRKNRRRMVEGGGGVLPGGRLVLSYEVSKFLIVQCTTFIYLITFLGAYNQNLGLFGVNGIQPISTNYWNPILEKYFNQYNNNNNNNLSWLSSWSWKIQGFLHHPSIFWWIPVTDTTLQSISLLGMTLSLGSIVLQLQRRGRGDNSSSSSSMLVMFLLWIFDFSIVTIASQQGTNFYSYGWESQLLETGFLTIFLCDTILPTIHSVSTATTTTTTVVPSSSSSHYYYNLNNSSSSSMILYLFQWLCFRISIGAGLIKIRGDSCWTQKTCLLYHFETQPIPSPFSFIFHFLPSWMLRHAVTLDLFVQVYTSWMVLVPSYLIGIVYYYYFFEKVQQQRQNNQNTTARTTTTTTTTTNHVERFLWNVYQISIWLLRMGGFIQAGFMINIMLSGNFAFLNHLTIIPALACLDDDCWPRVVRNYVIMGYNEEEKDDEDDNDNDEVMMGEDDGTASSPTINVTTPVGRSSTSSSSSSSSSWWSRSRTVLRILVFGRIMYLSRPVIENLLQWNGRRQQMNASYDPFRLVGTYGAFGSVGQGRYEPIISVTYNYKEWYELNFPCKPGKIDRRPCFCAPYHYRIDWNIWFLGFKPHANMLRGRESWVFQFVVKLLTKPSPPPATTTTITTSSSSSVVEQRPWLDLLDSTSSKMLRDNYEHKYQTPVAVKVEMYHYQMAAPLWEIVGSYLQRQLIPTLLKPLRRRQQQQQQDQTTSSSVIWWNRTFEEVLIPPVTWDPGEDRLVRVNIQ